MSEQRKQINYAIACVIEFAKRYNISVKKAFDFLFQYKAIEFIKENYDIEHTLSLDDALDDMIMICRNNGGIILYHGTNLDIEHIDLNLCRNFS